LQEAAEAAALADLLDTQITQLSETDDIYSYYLVHTALTRANAHRAELELANRHATTPPLDDATTTEEWLAAEQQARETDDAYRDISAEHDLTELANRNDADRPTLTDTTDRGPIVETAVPDIRELATAQGPRPVDDSVHVPTIEQTTNELAQARRAIAETQQRQAAEARHAAEYAHSQQLARWSADDHAITDQHTQAHTTDHIALPELTPAGPHD
jgi:hypothetical protein